MYNYVHIMLLFISFSKGIPLSLFGVRVLQIYKPNLGLLFIWLTFIREKFNR